MKRLATAMAVGALVASALAVGCADREGINWVGLWSEGDPPVFVYNYIDYYDDVDGDGHGDINDTEPVVYFEPVPGHAPSNDDCDDEDPDTHPGAEELCDDLDNDCDGHVGANEVDHDGDGTNECQGDCDDANALMNTLDLDHDGISSCEGDCDDADPEVYPGAPEYCDGKDNDCNGQIDDGHDDLDLDGYTECEDDCDDQDPNSYPGAPELCDRMDNDCDGLVPDDEIDNDGDGATECEDDCDDDNALSNLLDLDGDDYDTCGEDGIPDSGDEDCNDGDADLNLDDYDLDSWTTCTGECDDYDQNVHPNAPEICADLIDNDCDGDIDAADSECP